MAGVKPRQSGGAPLSTKTIKSIVDGFVRHIKEIAFCLKRTVTGIGRRERFMDCEGSSEKLFDA